MNNDFVITNKIHSGTINGTRISKADTTKRSRGTAERFISNFPEYNLAEEPLRSESQHENHDHVYGYKVKFGGQMNG